MIQIGDENGPAGRNVRVVGLMSGTSCDGIDAAIVDVSESGFELRAFACCPYDEDMRRDLLKLCSPETCRIDNLCHLNFALGELLAEAVVRVAENADVDLASIDLIGSHGHTVWHMPQGRKSGEKTVRSTLQIGEPSVIAERTGITTVADFRPRDMAAGGQGAPLVPYVDYRLFHDENISRAMLNIGGIANVTYLRAGGGPEQIVAFDTGPGNMVIDRVASRLTGGKLRCDVDGARAAKGTPARKLVDALLENEYFHRKPPKTTGREAFGESFTDVFLALCLAKQLDEADMVATATALTAESIAGAVRDHLPGEVDEVIVSGGGALNPTLMGMLVERLAPARVHSTAQLGLDPEAKEAMAFAILAVETVHGRANNVPAATGATRPVVMGKIVPGRG